MRIKKDFKQSRKNEGRKQMILNNDDDKKSKHYRIPIAIEFVTSDRNNNIMKHHSTYYVKSDKESWNHTHSAVDSRCELQNSRFKGAA